MDDVLELIPECPALALVRLGRRRFEQTVHLGIGVMARIGKNEADLEVLRPVGALNAQRRIEGIGEGFDDDIPGAVCVDRLQERCEVELQDFGIDADDGKRLLDEIGVGGL